MGRIFPFVAITAVALSPAVAISVYYLSGPEVSAPSTDDVAEPIAAEPEEESTPEKSPPLAEILGDDRPQNLSAPNSSSSLTVPPAPRSDLTALPNDEQSPPQPLPQDVPAATGDSAGEPVVRSQLLRREGTHLDNVVGTIQKRGVRYAFIPTDGSMPLLLLENQMLQRVENHEASHPRAATPTQWKVRGTVTEYRGVNYLLITAITVDHGP